MDSSPTLSAFSRMDSQRRGIATFSNIEQRFACFAAPIVLLFVASVLLLAGYRPQNVWIGPNSSMLLRLTPLFVQSVTVRDLDDSKSGLELFGFYKAPPLNVAVNWSQSHLVSVPHRSHKEWPLYLNNGASLDISYRIKPEGSSVHLVVGEGSHSIETGSEWLLEEAGRYQPVVVSWNLVRGSGVIHVNMNEPSDYYVAVANPHMKDIEVELVIDVRAMLYDTQHSYYKCGFKNGECTFNTMSLFRSSIVITTAMPRHGASNEENEWYIRLSFQPRYMSFMIGTGLVLCILVIVTFTSKRRERHLGERGYISGDDTESPEGAFLLENKEDDGSSDESLATEDNDLKEFMDGEDRRRVCAICFDAPKNCFFLPCGHSISCYECGTRIAETSATCPICRRKLKRVQRIYAM